MKNDSLLFFSTLPMTMVGTFGVTYNLAKYVATGNMTRNGRLGLAGGAVCFATGLATLYHLANKGTFIE